MIVRSTKLPFISESDISRFWSKVELTANPDRCWNWTAFKQRGYGRFSASASRVPLIATRVSYFIKNNVDPVGAMVLHKCDNPSCVNPNHLFLGDGKDNAADMFSKGRANPPKGDDHWRRKFSKDQLSAIYNRSTHKGANVNTAKLSESDVIELRKLHNNGAAIKDLSARFGISSTNVDCIVKGKTWKHIL